MAPRGTTPVELLIATDSFDRELGYAVPPGDWGIQVTLCRLDGTAETSARTPILPLTITTWAVTPASSTGGDARAPRPG